jgi:hypothetical protein
MLAEDLRQTVGGTTMNKFLGVAFGLTLALLAKGALAQAPAAKIHDLRRDSTTSQTAPTPEMWLYEQERTRYEDPRAAVRRKAEQRAAQRADRLAAMKWYGQSNARPVVAQTPYCDTYGAGWVGNGTNTKEWRPSNSVTVVARPGAGTY